MHQIFKLQNSTAQIVHGAQQISSLRVYVKKFEIYFSSIAFRPKLKVLNKFINSIWGSQAKTVVIDTTIWYL